MTAKNLKKATWVVQKERHKRSTDDTLWLFGIHAVRAAIMNPRREILRLTATPNAVERLRDAITARNISPEIQDARQFKPPLDSQSIHQGVALQTKPLVWDSLSEHCAPKRGTDKPVIVVLDRISDPHNVGAILRSAEVFGARAVVATARHSAPETGALAKVACGALERQPYLPVQNLVRAMAALAEMGYCLIGLDETGAGTIDEVLRGVANAPIALVMGAEGAGLRESTKTACTHLARIGWADGLADLEADAFSSLNVSNAAAISLYAARHRGGS